MIWVGGMFFALVVLRPSLAVLPPADRIALHLQVFRKFFLVIWHAMPIVLLTGYAMLFGIYGGFADVGWNVHVMHLCGLIMAVVFVVMFWGPWKALRSGGGERGGRPDPQAGAVNLVLGLLTVVVAAFV